MNAAVSYIHVEISEEVNQCSCCGKNNLKRTVFIHSDETGELYIGVICASKWFGLTMTGNPFYAADKLQEHINTLEPEEFFEILDNIKEAAEEW